MHLRPARQTAAELLAAATLDLFPGTQRIQGQGTSQIFFYDFAFPLPFHPEMLGVIEERMRLLVKGKPEIRVCEMMAGNAATRMEHEGQSLIAERLRRRGQECVSMVQVGSHMDWCEFPCVAAFDPQWAFKLVEAYPVRIGGVSGVRIIGALCADKNSLKQWVKSKPSYAERYHVPLVEKLQLLTPLEEGLWAWLPEGEKVQQVLKGWWRTAHEREGFVFVTTPRGCCLRELPRGKAVRVAEFFSTSSEENRVNEGLLQTGAWLTDLAQIVCTREELLNECISSLQFIIKIPKILGFEFQIVLTGGSFLRDSLRKMDLDYIEKKEPQLKKGECRVSLFLPDSLGRWWESSWVRVSGQEVMRSTFSSLERLVGLLVEQKGHVNDLFKLE